jgi:hypothetical protein
MCYSVACPFYIKEHKLINRANHAFYDKIETMDYLDPRKRHAYHVRLVIGYVLIAIWSTAQMVMDTILRRGR